MRTRRIIMAAVLSAATGSAFANPYITPDPSIQRGAAAQLAKTIGGLRGTITEKDIPVQQQAELDHITTRGTVRLEPLLTSRAMTPGEWLKTKRAQEAGTVAEIGNTGSSAAVPGLIVLPVEAPVIPPVYPTNVRVIYTNNAPIW